MAKIMARTECNIKWGGENTLKNAKDAKDCVRDGFNPSKKQRQNDYMSLVRDIAAFKCDREACIQLYATQH